MLFENYIDNIDEIIRIGNECKKESNKNPNFTQIWRNEFAPSNHIGHTNKLLHRYGVLYFIGDYNDKLRGFIKYYLADTDPKFNLQTLYGSISHGRDVKQVKAIANHISERCREENITFSNSMENDIEKLMCLIIDHACSETLAGKYNELIVEEYFNSFGLYRKNYTDISDSEWDSNGVDILLYNGDKIFRFVQVKPVSFMLGNKPDLCNDRKKCVEQNQPYVDDYMQIHYLEAHPNMRIEIIYCFYNKDHLFVNFRGNNTDNGVFIEYNEFANNDGTPKYTSTDLLKMPKVDLTLFKKKVSES